MTEFVLDFFLFLFFRVSIRLFVVCVQLVLIIRSGWMWLNELTSVVYTLECTSLHNIPLRRLFCFCCLLAEYFWLPSSHCEFTDSIFCFFSLIFKSHGEGHTAQAHVIFILIFNSLRLGSLLLSFTANSATNWKNSWQKHKNYSQKIFFSFCRFHVAVCVCVSSVVDVLWIEMKILNWMKIVSSQQESWWWRDENNIEFRWQFAYCWAATKTKYFYRRLCWCCYCWCYFGCCCIFNLPFFFTSDETFFTRCKHSEMGLFTVNALRATMRCYCCSAILFFCCCCYFASRLSLPFALSTIRFTCLALFLFYFTHTHARHVVRSNVNKHKEYSSWSSHTHEMWMCVSARELCRGGIFHCCAGPFYAYWFACVHECVNVCECLNRMMVRSDWKCIHFALFQSNWVLFCSKWLISRLASLSLVLPLIPVSPFRLMESFYFWRAAIISKRNWRWSI